MPAGRAEWMRQERIEATEDKGLELPPPRRTDYAPVGLTWVLEQRRNQQTTDAAGKVNR